MIIPRLVAFDSNGRATVAGCAASILQCRGARTEICNLPSKHYDFIDVDVRGMTFPEIRDRWGQ